MNLGFEVCRFYGYMVSMGFEFCGFGLGGVGFGVVYSTFDYVNRYDIAGFGLWVDCSSLVEGFGVLLVVLGYLGVCGFLLGAVNICGCGFCCLGFLGLVGQFSWFV